MPQPPDLSAPLGIQESKKMGTWFGEKTPSDPLEDGLLYEIEDFLVNQLPQIHHAKGCTKQLLDAGIDLTPLESGTELNCRGYQLGHRPIYFY